MPWIKNRQRTAINQSLHVIILSGVARHQSSVKLS